MEKTLRDLSYEYIEPGSAGNKSLKISNTISSFSLIGNFGGYSNDLQNHLTSITHIGDKVQKIDDYCFYNCLSLQLVKIPSTVNKFGDYSFYGCTSLTSQIPQFGDNSTPVYAIGAHAFEGNKIKTLNLKLAGRLYTQESDYQNCKPTTPEDGPYVGTHAFANCTELKTINMLSSTELGDFMFDGCTSLTEVNFANRGACVGQYAFQGCTSLKSITFPPRFEMISKGMFNNCTNLESVVIQNSKPDDENGCFIGIDAFAFNNTPKLTSITLPEALTDPDIIDDNAFRGSSLLSVYLNGVASSDFNKYFVLSSKTSTQTITTYEEKPVTSKNDIQFGKYKLGVMYDSGDFKQVWEVARKNHIPFFGYYTKMHGCGNCTQFRSNVSETDAFKKWVSEQPYLFCRDNTGVCNMFFHGTPSQEKNYGFSWPKDKGTGSVTYVCLGLAWIKSNGSYNALRKMAQTGKKSRGSFDEVKEYVQQTFGGFDISQAGSESTKMEQTPVEKTVTTTTPIIVQKNFTGYGIGHQCTFITKEGAKFTYYPTTTSQNKYSLTTSTTALDASGDGVNTSGPTVTPQSCTINFYNQNEELIKSFTVPSGATPEFYAPCSIHMNMGTNKDCAVSRIISQFAHVVFPSVTVTKSITDTNVIHGWEPSITDPITHDTDFYPIVKNTVGVIFFNNDGEIYSRLDGTPATNTSVSQTLKKEYMPGPGVAVLGGEWPKEPTYQILQAPESGAVEPAFHWQNTSTYLANKLQVINKMQKIDSNNLPKFVKWIRIKDFNVSKSNATKWQSPNFLSSKKAQIQSLYSGYYFLFPIYSNYPGVKPRNKGCTWNINMNTFLKSLYFSSDKLGEFGIKDTDGQFLAYYKFPFNYND